MRRSGIFVSALAAALLLAGCGTSGPPTSQFEDESGGNGVLPAGAIPQTRYDLANGCYALKSVRTASHAARSGGAYAATAPNVTDAEPFFMKPTALGKYLFYARDRSFLAVVGPAVGKASAPSDAADWTIDTDAAGDYTVFSASAGKSLAVAPGDGSLILVDRASAGDAAKFGFDAATGCAPIRKRASTPKGRYSRAGA